MLILCCTVSGNLLQNSWGVLDEPNSHSVNEMFNRTP